MLFEVIAICALSAGDWPQFRGPKSEFSTRAILFCFAFDPDDPLRCSGGQTRSNVDSM